jgi:uncharacterized membrane protein YozB (DUF420 family)
MNLFSTLSVLFHREYFWRSADKRKTNIEERRRINVRFEVLIGMSMKMAAFRYVLSCGTDRRFRGSYCLPLMEAVSNSLQLNQLLSSIKSIWITIVKSDAETGLTSRYLAIILMVVYSTRRLLTKSVSNQKQVNDKLIFTAMLYIVLALSCNLLLGIDCTWPKLSSPLAHQLVWTRFCLVRPTPRYSHYTHILTHCLMETVSTSETQVSFCWLHIAASYKTDYLD